MEKYSEIELTKLINRGQNPEAAFNELYSRYSYELYNHCRFMCDTEPEAEDIFQQAWMRFYNNAVAGQKFSNPRAYIFRIVTNLCHNVRRDRKAIVSLDESGRLIDAQGKLTNDLSKSMDRDELFHLVELAAGQLPDKYREVYIMKKFEGMKCREIADLLEISYNSAKKRLTRATEQVMTILQPYMEDLSKFT